MVKSRLRTLCLALVAAGSFVPAAGADDCSTIRLDEAVRSGGRTIEGSMFRVRVRDQRQIGSCYAHAAAQMYDAWRFRHLSDLQPEDFENFSSGFEIGQRFKINENEKVEKNSRLLGRMDKSIDGGFVERILPFLLEEGTCSQQELNGLFDPAVRLRGEALDVDLYASEVMTRFNRYRNDFYKAKDAIFAKYFPPQTDDPSYPNYVGKPAWQRPGYLSDHRIPNVAYEMERAKRIREGRRAAAKETAVEREKFLKQALVELRTTHAEALSNKQTYKSINYRALQQMVREWSADDINTVKMFELLSTIDCPDARRLKTRGRFEVAKTSTYPYVVNLFGKSGRQYAPAKMRATLDAELNKGHAKAYPIGIGYCSSILSEGRAFFSKARGTDACGRHASLVIGRRRDPTNRNRCQYLIRNTWGARCSSSYHKDWECDGPKGSIWIDADALGRATYVLQTIRTIED